MSLGEWIPSREDLAALGMAGEPLIPENRLAQESAEDLAFKEKAKEVFKFVDRRVAIKVERGVYQAGTALAIMHEFRESFARIVPMLDDELIPHFTEGAIRGLERLAKPSADETQPEAKSAS